MRNLRIVFMGTPDFAVSTLSRLVEDGFNVVGVVTSVDKKAGRGQKVRQSEVKKYALSKKLPILQPTNLKSDEFLTKLKLWDANLHIVVAFRMLPKVVWNLPQYGTFNLHASLLPEYRGAAPIHWAIINGETETGVTTFFIDQEIDTGAIILQDKTPIKPDETVGTLYNRLMIMGADLVCQTVNLIKKDRVKTTKQTGLDNKLAPKLNPENCRINWNDDLDTVYNHIRGLNPHPVAWTIIKNKEKEVFTKIYDVSKEFVTHQLEIGKIYLENKELKVAVKNGFLIINQLKIAGKNKMDSKSLLNGYQIDKNAHMIL